MSTMVRKARELADIAQIDRASSDPQRMGARKTEAEIMEKMCRPGQRKHKLYPDGS